MNYLTDPKYVAARQQAVADEIREARLRPRWVWVTRLGSLVRSPTSRRSPVAPVIPLAERRSDQFDRAMEHYLERRHAA